MSEPADKAIADCKLTKVDSKTITVAVADELSFQFSVNDEGRPTHFTWGGVKFDLGQIVQSGKTINTIGITQSEDGSTAVVSKVGKNAVAFPSLQLDKENSICTRAEEPVMTSEREIYNGMHLVFWLGREIPTFFLQTNQDMQYVFKKNTALKILPNDLVLSWDNDDEDSDASESAVVAKPATNSGKKSKKNKKK